MVSSSEVGGLLKRILILEEFVQDNIAPPKKGMEKKDTESLNFAPDPFREKKARNLYNLGQAYLDILQENFPEKRSILEYPLRERINYLQVQQNDACRDVEQLRHQQDNMTNETKNVFETANLAKELISSQQKEMGDMKQTVSKLREDMKGFDHFITVNNKKHDDLLKYSHRLEDTLNQLKSDYRKMTELTQN
jgi:hypothetical protein